MSRPFTPLWVIQCKSDRMSFWSNRYGWVYTGFDTFTDGDKVNNTLPIDGAWRPWGTLSIRQKDVQEVTADNENTLTVDGKVLPENNRTTGDKDED